MNLIETNAFLTWLNQHDPRVSNSVAAVEIWQASLIFATPAEAKQAAIEHYRGNDTIPATAAGIRKRVGTLRTTAEAKTRAITATPHQTTNPHSYRSRNPALWDQLLERGAQERRHELHAKGLLPDNQQ